MSETFFPLAFWEKKFCIYKLPRNVLFIIETSMKYQTIWLFFLAVKGAVYHVACHSDSDIFTCEDNMLFSHVKISCFCVGWNWLSLSLRCFIAVPSLGKGQCRDNKSPKFLGWLISNSCYLFLVQSADFASAKLYSVTYTSYLLAPLPYSPLLYFAESHDH